MSNLIDDLNFAKEELQRFAEDNQSAIGVYLTLLDNYDAALKSVEDAAKAQAAENGEPVTIGPVTMKPEFRPQWDLDEVAEVLDDNDFDLAVRVEYKLRTLSADKTDGDAILRRLMEKYPALEKLRTMRLNRVVSDRKNPKRGLKLVSRDGMPL